jgi:transglutaminase-like putative cysteine protease
MVQSSLRYRVTHTTTYAYAKDVVLCHNQARLVPRAIAQQTCVSSTLQVAPRPHRIDRYLDPYGNVVQYFSIDEPHRELAVTACSEVHCLLDQKQPELEASTPWEEVAASLAQGQGKQWLAAYEFMLPSPFAETGRPYARLARAHCAPCKPVLQVAHDLMMHIFHEWEYDKGFSTVHTPLQDVVRHKKGVCQDFAHAFLACLRSLGLAARYVSGYLETVPPPGKEKLVGADASHAWAEVYCPRLGWVGFDPTNGTIPSSQHIIVALGRDYGDVMPLNGVVYGGGEGTLQVAVDVARLEDRSGDKPGQGQEERKV